MKAMKYENEQKISNGYPCLQLNQILIGHAQEGIMFSNSLNSSLSVVDDPHCHKGVYIFDPRCRFWYMDTIKQESFIMHSPRLSVGQANPYLSQFSCQKLLKFNQSGPLSEDDVYSVICIETQLSSLRSFFTNVMQSSKQSYIIHPSSQLIVYNSKQTDNFDSLQMLQSVEFDNLKDQQQAKMFNETMNQYYNLWVQMDLQNANIAEQQSSSNGEYVIFPYIRNGTQYQVILNPIIIYERKPEYVQTSQKQENTRSSVVYLQINIISDEDLREQSKQLIGLVQSLFIFIGVFLVLASLIFICINFYYSLKITFLVEAPLELLTKMLKRIRKQNRMNELQYILSSFEQKAEDIFLSKETRHLYVSFYEVFQKLLYTTEHFFSENETNTLVSLCQKIYFFRQFDNIQAAGITHNNIGTILLNQQHYFQALDHFSSSIIYAKYEIQSYCQKNPTSQFTPTFARYCFENNKSKGQQHEDTKIMQMKSNNTFLKNQKSFYIDGYIPSKSKISSLFVGNQKLRDSQQQLNKRNNKKENKKNSIYQRQIQNDSDHLEKNYSMLKKMREQKSKILLSYKRSEKEEEEYKEAMYLLQTLYYRQSNYIITLIAFQEHQDEQNKNEPSLFNFWLEIKQLIKQMLVLSNHLPNAKQLEITILLLLSKSYFKLNQFQKAEQAFEKSEYLLKYVSIIEKKQKPHTQLNQININNLQQKQQKSPSIQKNNGLSYNIPKRKRESILNENQNNFQIFFNQPTHPNTEQDLSLKKEVLETNNISQISFCHLDKSQGIKQQQQQQNFQSNSSIIQYRNKTFSEFLEHTNANKINTQKLSEIGIIKKIKSEESQVLFDLEQYFNFKRNKTQIEIEEKLIFFLNVSSQSLLQILNFTKAEYYIFKKEYANAAEILTLLLEDSQNLMSHYPYRIVHKLKKIFNNCGIPTGELKEIQRKFNKNQSISMTIIFACNNKHKNNFLSLQLVSDLVSTVLTQANDQIGILILDYQDTYIQKYQELIKVSQIKSIIHKIIYDIQSLIYNKNSIEFFQNILNLDSSTELFDDSKQQSYLSQNHESNSQNLSILNQRVQEGNYLFESSFEESSQTNCDKIIYIQNFKQLKDNNSKQLKEVNPMQLNQKSFQDKDYNLKLVQDKEQIFNLKRDVNGEQFYNQQNFVKRQNKIESNQQIIENNRYQQYLFYNQFNEDKQNNIETKGLSNHLTYQHYQVEKPLEHPGDEQQSSQQQFTFSSLLGCSVLDLKVNENANRNYLFHMAVRKSINQLFSEKMKFEYTKFNYHSQNYIQQINEDETFISYLQKMSFLESSKTQHTQKYILYSTDEIGVIQNTLFYKLCAILSTLKIQLIIISSYEGDNFLEKMLDHTFIYENQEIIIIFYSIKKLTQYLNFKKDSFTSYTYTTFIQHF